MIRKQDSAKARINQEEFKQLLAEDRDLLKIIVEQTVQQVLEAEMEEALQAGKSERTECPYKNVITEWNPSLQ